MHFAKLAADRASAAAGRHARGPERGSPLRWAAIPAVVTAFMVMFLPAAASAAPSAPVTFTGTITVSAEPTGNGANGGITNTGSWTASGAVTGSFAISEPTTFGGAAIHYDGTLTGSYGTITIRVNARFVAADASHVYVSGVWSILSGTGAYANLAGQGDYSGTIDRTVTPKVVTESLTGYAEDGS